MSTCHAVVPEYLLKRLYPWNTNETKQDERKIKNDSFPETPCRREKGYGVGSTGT